MKKGIFLLLTWCMIALGLQAQGTYTTVSRFQGKNISSLDVSGAWNIQLTQGRSTRVELTFPERFKEQLVVSLEQGELKIGFRGNIKSKSGEKFEAVIVCSSLEEIELSGACVLNGTGNFSGENVSFDLSGAVKVNMEGPVTVATGLEIELSGASKLLARQISTRILDIDLSGASNLELGGKADMGGCEASGASKFDLSGLQIANIIVDMSGASNGRLNVSEQIKGEISGASRLVYSGAASARVDVSGAANLKHQ